VSAAIALAPEISFLRARDEELWTALVNAASTWCEVSPALFADIDWDALIAVARYHGVMPILTQRVLESAIPLDPATRDKLRRSYQANLIRSLPLADEILRIVTACTDRGIRIIPYKGPVLAESLWGNAALRECADLDFLIEEQNADRAGDLLHSLGYRRVSPLPPHLHQALLRNASEEQFRHRDTGLLLELQWSPAPRVFALNFDAAQFWTRPHQVLFSGHSVLGLSSEDLFMLLAIHGWKHNWERLIWVGDIAQLMRSATLDWDRLLAGSNQASCFRLLSLALRMVDRVFGIAPPHQFVSPDPALDRLAGELQRRMIGCRPCAYLDWHRCMLPARDSPFDRVRQLTTFFAGRPPDIASFDSDA
jgi:hypothetical protein